MEAVLCRACEQPVFSVIYELNSCKTGIVRTMLEICVPQMNCDLTPNPMLCESCLEYVKSIYDFKNKCLATERKISKRKSSAPLDLLSFLEQKYRSDKFNDCNVCRLCLNIENNALGIDEKVENLEVGIIRQIIKSCLPELDLSISLEPYLCRNCLDSLQIYSAFHGMCLETEKKMNFVQIEALQKEMTIKTENETYDNPEYVSLKDEIECKDNEFLELTACDKINKNEEDIVIVSDNDSCGEIYVEVEHTPKRNKKRKSVFTLSDQDSEEDASDSEYFPEHEYRPKRNKKRKKVFTLGNTNDEDYEEDSSDSDYSPGEEVRKRSKLNNKPKNIIKGQHSSDIEHELKKEDTDNNFKELRSKQYENITIFQDQSGIRQYECKSCKLLTRWKIIIFNHNCCHRNDEAFKRDVFRFQCSECDFSSYRKDHLDRHMGHHNTTNYPECKICHFRTTTKWSLKRHIKNMHTKKEDKYASFICSDCGFCTKKKGILNRHKLIHLKSNAIKIYKCLECDFVTNWSESLSKHVIKHKDEKFKMYKCHICKFCSRWSRVLKNHLKSAH